MPSKSLLATRSKIPRLAVPERAHVRRKLNLFYVMVTSRCANVSSRLLMAQGRPATAATDNESGYRAMTALSLRDSVRRA